MRKKDTHTPNPYITTHRKGAEAKAAERTICVNAACKLRKAGCYGADGCFGFKPKPEKPR